jgi:hypothetical protein
LKIPQTADEVATISLQNVPADWRTNAAVKTQITEKINQFVSKPSNADLYNLDMSIKPTPEGEKTAQQKSFWQNTLDAFNSQNQFKQDIGQGIFNAGENVVKGIGEKLAPVANKVATGVKNLLTPVAQPTMEQNAATAKRFTASLNNPLGLNTPANLGNNFKMPEFSMPSQFTGFSGFTPSQNQLPQTVNQPATGINLPKVDFLGGIKKLGQQVISGIGTGVSNLWKSTVGRVF